MDDIEYTPEELAQAQRIVAAEQVRQAALAQARAEAYAAPVRELVGSAAWSEVLAGLNEIQANYEPDDTMSIHVGALCQIMPNLAVLAPANPTALPVAA